MQTRNILNAVSVGLSVRALGGDERYLLVRLANWYTIAPHARPLMMPTMVAMGIEVAGSPRATPPTKMTASRPVG